MHTSSDAMTPEPPSSVVLRASGVMIAFRIQPDRVPDVLYWGRDELSPDVFDELLLSSDPAVMNSSFDTPRRFSIAPNEAEGWSGAPGFQWHRAGDPGRGLRLLRVEQHPHQVSFLLVDDHLEVELRLDYEIDQGGVIAAQATVTNTAADADAVLDVSGISLLLPIPPRASQIVDQTGRWSGERRPQRVDIVDGSHVRSVRRGRPGHDSPLVSLVGTSGFAFRSGEVWAAHVAWSGNQEYLVERLPEGAGVATAVMGGGELLTPGEIRLSSEEAYSTPDVLFTWSDSGIDGISSRLHARVRRGAGYPSSPRPLVLNTWEAVYFEHDFTRLSELATVAARIGVERFVLDDGWFPGRHDDGAGLGDWSVDETTWPDGLAPIADLVHRLGMEFGLWFEPEMVNLDSDVARAHPEWILQPSTPQLAWRHQFVLDLSNPAAYRHVLERMSRIIDDTGVDFLKWDHNRDLHAPVSEAGRPRTHAQTLATYALMDELRAQHRGLEIESCASGGARIDLGIMAHAQRVWASDTNDPIERQAIQRWTEVLLPPELIGSHVGAERSHTTGRATALSFRLATALFAHAGIEMDLTALDVIELDAIAAWAGLYRELRPLLHSGVTVRADDADPGALLHGVVSDDRRHAVFAWVRLETSATAHTARVILPGLDDTAQYSIRIRPEVGSASRHELADPAWMGLADQTWSGSLLGHIGLPLPKLNPGQAMVLELRAPN